MLYVNVILESKIRTKLNLMFTSAIVGRLIATHWRTEKINEKIIEKCWLLIGSLLRIGRQKNVDCWSAHCYTLADGKIPNSWDISPYQSTTFVIFAENQVFWKIHHCGVPTYTRPQYKTRVYFLHKNLLYLKWAHCRLEDIISETFTHMESALYKSWQIPNTKSLPKFNTPPSAKYTISRH